MEQVAITQAIEWRINYCFKTFQFFINLLLYYWVFFGLQYTYSSSVVELFSLKNKSNAKENIFVSVLEIITCQRKSHVMKASMKVS